MFSTPEKRVVAGCESSRFERAVEIVRFRICMQSYAAEAWRSGAGRLREIWGQYASSSNAFQPQRQPRFLRETRSNEQEINGSGAMTRAAGFPLTWARPNLADGR